MQTFLCWEPSHTDEAGCIPVSAPMAYQAAQKYAADKDRRVLEYPMSRTIHVRHPEGFVDTFEVELSSTPIYTAKRKKPQ